jgi:hypothetical protein
LEQRGKALICYPCQVDNFGAVSAPPKKGPKMTQLSSHADTSREKIGRSEFEAELAAHADKVFYAIEEARAKMTPADREKADAEADSILQEATRAAAPLRRRA